MFSPLSICWNITSSCNLNCDFCYREKHAKTIPKDFCQSVIEKISNAGVKRLVIAGGEPMLVPHVDWLLQISKNEGLITSLITNGVLLSEKFIYENEDYLDEIVLSIDGEDSITHSRMRAVSNMHFDHLLKCLELLAKMNIRSRVNSMVSKKNISNLENLGKLLIQLDVDEWRIMQFYPMNDAFEKSFLHNISKEQFDRFTRQVKEIYKNTNLYLTFGDTNNMSGSYFSVSPDGKVFTSNLGKVLHLGNILNDSIEEIFQNTSIDKQKHLSKYKIVEDWDGKK